MGTIRQVIYDEQTGSSGQYRSFPASIQCVVVHDKPVWSQTPQQSGTGLGILLP